MKLFFLLMPLLYLGANLYLYLRTLQQLSGLPLGVRILLSLLFWVAAVAIFAALFAERAAWPMGLVAPLFRAGSVWMLFLLYMVLSLLVADLIHWLQPAFRWGYPAALIFTTLILIVGHLCYLHPRIERLEIDLEKPLAQPVKVVAVSDLHLGYGTGCRRLGRYVEMINREQPDLVVVVGDLIDNSVRPVREKRMLKLFDGVEASEGIWMVPGNHEYISGMADCEALLAESSIHLLRDEVREVSGLQLVGRDDRSNRHRLAIDSLLQRVDSARPALLLDHQPYDLAVNDRPELDLHLYGHTHRGQVWPLNWLTDRLYEQSHGCRRWNHSCICVSSGLSLWGPPFRIGTRSELWVITLK